MMDCRGHLLGFATQRFVDLHRFPPLFFSVEQRPLGDRNVHHLLKTKRLGAKLHSIPVLFLTTTPFMLHRIGLPGAIGLPVKLHHVGLAYQSQPQAPDR